MTYISWTIKDEENITSVTLNDGTEDRKRNRCGKDAKVEEALKRWVV